MTMKKLSVLAAGVLVAAGATTFALRGQSDTLPDAGVKIGASVAPFQLVDATSKKQMTVGGPGAKATVVLFVATRCPVSLAYDSRMAKLAADYQPKGVKFYGVNSNKQEDIAEIAGHAADKKLGFPVLKDPGHVIADRFGAQVTPEAYVLDAQGKLVYHGQFDNEKNEAKVTQTGLKDALDAVLAGKLLMNIGRIIFFARQYMHGVGLRINSDG